MKRWPDFTILLITVVLVTAYPVAAGTTREKCDEHLKTLGQLCLTYAGQNDGNMPQRLSELYYQAYTFELDAFVCPCKPVEIEGRAEIDQKSGYVLSPASDADADPRPLVQDRSAKNHDGKGINVFYSDGTIRWQEAAEPEPGPAPDLKPRPEPRPQTTPAPKAIAEASAKGWMGLKIQTLTGELAKRLGIEPTPGVRLEAVLRGGPAHVARLRSGDIVTYIDGTPVDKAKELAALTAQLLPGELIDIDIVRNSKLMSIRAVVGRRPTSDRAAPRPTAPSSERQPRAYTPTGRWEWYVNGSHWGHIVFEMDKVTGYDLQGRKTNTGTWGRVKDKKDTIQIRWDKGRWVDTLKFSTDGATLTGKNNANARLRAERAF